MTLRIRRLSPGRPSLPLSLCPLCVHVSHRSQRTNQRRPVGKGRWGGGGRGRRERDTNPHEQDRQAAGVRGTTQGTEPALYDNFRCSCYLVTLMPDSPASPWTVAHQPPLPMEFSRQECWSGLPFPSPGGLLDPGIEPTSPALQADSLPLSHQGSP